MNASDRLAIQDAFKEHTTAGLHKATGEALAAIDKKIAEASKQSGYDNSQKLAVIGALSELKVEIGNWDWNWN